MLIAVALAAVLLVSGCGSSRAVQATDLTPSQLHARAVREDVQREAVFRARAVARLRHVHQEEVQREARFRARAAARLRHAQRKKH